MGLDMPKGHETTKQTNENFERELRVESLGVKTQLYFLGRRSAFDVVINML